MYDKIFAQVSAEDSIMVDEHTRKYNLVTERADIRQLVGQVYESLRVKGYNPINQLVGYILSDDPTYITNYNNARSIICRVDREELLRELVTSYLEK